MWAGERTLGSERGLPLLGQLAGCEGTLRLALVAAQQGLLRSKLPLELDPKRRARLAKALPARQLSSMAGATDLLDLLGVHPATLGELRRARTRRRCCRCLLEAVVPLLQLGLVVTQHCRILDQGTVSAGVPRGLRSIGLIY